MAADRSTRTETVGGPQDSRPPEAWKPEDGLTFWPGAGRRQCTARARKRARETRGATRCTQIAMKGKTKCYRCGGKSTGPPIKHGRFSQAFGRLAQRYEDNLAAEQLLAAGPRLAGLDTLIEDVLERALVERDGLSWRRQLVRQLERYLEAKDADPEDKVAQRKAARHLARLETMIRDGARTAAELDRASKMLERRQKLAEQVRKNDLGERQVYTYAAVVTLLRLIQQTILEEVREKGVAARIIDSVDRRLALAGGQAADPTQGNDGA